MRILIWVGQGDGAVVCVFVCVCVCVCVCVRGGGLGWLGSCFAVCLLKLRLTLGNRPALVIQLDARPTCDQEAASSTPAGVGNILLWRFDHELFSTVILSRPLILVKECAQY